MELVPADEIVSKFLPFQSPPNEVSEGTRRCRYLFDTRHFEKMKAAAVHHIDAGLQVPHLHPA